MARGPGVRTPPPFFSTIVQSLVPFDGERVEDIRVLQNYAHFRHNGTMYINDFKSTREHLGTFHFSFFARAGKGGHHSSVPSPPSGLRPSARASPLLLGPPFFKKMDPPMILHKLHQLNIYFCVINVSIGMLK